MSQFESNLQKYSYILIQAVLDTLDQEIEESSDSKISVKELLEKDNLTSFFHALGATMPTYINNKLTDDDLDLLEMNYRVNRLICQQLIESEDTIIK